MKVLFISNDPSVFNPESATRARMRLYAQAGGELHILSRGPISARMEQEGALTLHPLHGPRLFTLFSMEGAARRIIRTYGIEVVSAQDPFEHGYAAMRATRGTSVRLHIQIHTDFLSPWFTRGAVFRSMRVPAPFLNRMRRRIADRVLPKAHGIRVVSARIRDSVLVVYNGRVPKPSVIPVAVSSVVPEPVPLPPHTFQFAFMCSGRLEPEKRVEDILMALGKIAQRFPSVGLIVVGEGSERRKLESLAKKLGLTGRVLFMGEQGKNAIGLMGSAHAFIQASAYEGYGRTLVEAALARIPIITTDVGIVGEVFRGYEHVLATPPGDTANLAAHMTAVVGDHQLRRSLVLNAEHAAKDHLKDAALQPKRIAEDLARTLESA